MPQTSERSYLLPLIFSASLFLLHPTPLLSLTWDSNSRKKTWFLRDSKARVLPWWLSGKEPACHEGDLGSIPGSCPWRRAWQPTPVFFLFCFISWRLITLQYGSGFYHTLTWISLGYTCVPHPDPPSHLPLRPIPLGFPSAPGPSTCLMHPAWAGDLFLPR